MTPTAATLAARASTERGPGPRGPRRVYNVTPRAIYETNTERRRFRRRSAVGRRIDTRCPHWRTRLSNKLRRAGNRLLERVRCARPVWAQRARTLSQQVLPVWVPWARLRGPPAPPSETRTAYEEAFLPS